MLPNLSIATFKTTLISDGKEIEYRPFLAKEQKLLLTALEGGTAKEVSKAVLDILKACILTPSVAVEKLPSFDIQKLFLELRKKSIGEVIELKARHKDENDPCKHQQKISVNLDDVKVLTHEDHSRKIKLSEQIGVVMRYPDTNMMEKYNDKSVETTFKIIADCVESVYDANNVYAEFTQKEMIDWLGTLNTQQFQKITSFFHNMPSLVYDIKYTCSKCKQPEEYRLEGLTDFFT